MSPVAETLQSWVHQLQQLLCVAPVGRLLHCFMHCSKWSPLVILQASWQHACHRHTAQARPEGLQRTCQLLPCFKVGSNPFTGAAPVALAGCQRPCRWWLLFQLCGVADGSACVGAVYSTIIWRLLCAIRMPDRIG